MTTTVYYRYSARVAKQIKLDRKSKNPWFRAANLSWYGSWYTEISPVSVLKKYIRQLATRFEKNRMNMPDAFEIDVILFYCTVYVGYSVEKL